MPTVIASTRAALVPSVLPPPEKTIDADEFLQELMREKQARDDETAGGFRVILYNDEVHSREEVELQVVKATGCDLEEAVEIVLEAHTLGRAICFRGARDECHRVARVLREIHLQVEVDCD